MSEEAGAVEPARDERAAYIRSLRTRSWAYHQPVVHQQRHVTFDEDGTATRVETGLRSRGSLFGPHHPEWQRRGEGHPAAGASTP